MCVLRAVGDSFDATAFLSRNSVSTYKIFRRGEVNDQRPGRTHETSGFCSAVSEREWTDRAGQFEDALSFIRANKSVLSALSTTPGVEEVVLDFPFEATGWATFVRIPLQLAREASALGVQIEISFYPPSEEDAQ